MRYGSDFSGMDMALFALKHLGRPVDHVFASDNHVKCQQFIAAVHGAPRAFYKDVATRDTATMTSVDLYVWGHHANRSARMASAEGPMTNEVGSHAMPCATSVNTVPAAQ